jgi:hypothetical protein
VYDFDEEAARENLNILNFPQADKTWLDFVVQNRFDRYDGIKYDIIEGAVANDDVYPTILLYESGDLTADETLSRLKSRKLFDQIALCSEKALSLLTFKSAFTPTGAANDTH